MLTATDVEAVAKPDDRLRAAKSLASGVAAATRAASPVCEPGVATPTEAFAAIHAGAHSLRLFPAGIIPAVAIKALRAVSAASVPMLTVGGIPPATMDAILQLGCMVLTSDRCCTARGKARP